MTTDWKSLAARARSGTGEDRELDAEVAVAAGIIVMRQLQDTNFAYWTRADYETPNSPCFAVSMEPFDIRSRNVPEVSSSIDAITALIKAELPGWCWSLDYDPDYATAGGEYRVEADTNDRVEVCSSPARALLAAFCEAKAMETQDA